MKWPKEIVLIRHDVSTYNVLKAQKREHLEYQEFLEEWKKDPFSDMTKALAHRIVGLFTLGTGDHDTPLIDSESQNAQNVGFALKQELSLPDVIYVSPYLRTGQTLEGLCKGWPELRGVETISERRVREQEHGIALLYNDWRAFFTLNPDQMKLQEIQGKFWYRFPQGESVSDVQDRNALWLTSVLREYREKNVLVVTHHLNILALLANLERWDDKTFLQKDRDEKPINCGVTLYRGDPSEGKDGRLVQEYYNRKFY